MNPIDKRLEVLVARARQALVHEELHPPESFASQVLSRVALQKNRSSQFSTFFSRFPVFNFADQPNTSEETALWMRFSLASLPVGLTVMIACLLWFGTEIPHGVDDLASSFVQSRLLP